MYINDFPRRFQLKHSVLQEPFDIGLVKAAFELCLAAEALDMDQYVYAYKELSRFFRLLGTAFGFVAQDVDDKIGILEKHRYEDGDAKHDALSR